MIGIVYLRLKSKSVIIDNNIFWYRKLASEAKFNEKWHNLDSDSENGKQNYKQSKNVE